MAKYAVNEEGIQALKTMAGAINGASGQILNLKNYLVMIASEYSDMLGPHKESIDSVIADIAQALWDASEPIAEISEMLCEVADAYQDILDEDILKASGTSRNSGTYAASDAAKGQAGAGNGKTAGSLMSRIFGASDRDKTAVRKFGQYEVDSHGFIKGKNYESYIKDWEGYDPGQFETQSFRDAPKYEMISPDEIEGMGVSDHDIDDPGIFWSQHEAGGTIDSFTEIASHIPEVQRELEGGRKLSDLKEDPRLGKCATLYFEPENIPKVIECDGYYEFQANGRHRMLAARELGYRICVRVIGTRKRKKFKAGASPCVKA